MDKPEFTVLLPVLNEETAIEKLVREIFEKMSDDLDLRVVAINDGSDDRTPELLDQLAQEFEGLSIVHHPVRCGKSAALRTGANVARTIWVGTMDGDGQDDPADLLAMCREIDLTTVQETGLVGGVRRARTDGDSRKYASRFANGLRKSLLKDDCPDTACGLKVLPRRLFLSFPFFDALHRYLPAFTKHFGFETRYVTVENRPRDGGESKYTNFGRAVAGLFDLTGVIWLMRRTKTPGRAFVADQIMSENRS
ncbi:glycosyltransferase family 2 protein [Parvularcula sp. IMCC14364]|uniref:glycosyltransferase family 2 protein n=1 Tax=Parvularcula sp. IMCC14364 TaxID=3067902 RepID=UPI0027426354|nr:glycosyltransferase family 2 protein [Parvularcula sp. IMCC14364]